MANLRPVPDDFTALRTRMSWRQMKAHYRVGADVIKRWDAEIGAREAVIAVSDADGRGRGGSEAAASAFARSFALEGRSIGYRNNWLMRAWSLRRKREQD